MATSCMPYIDRQELYYIDTPVAVNDSWADVKVNLLSAETSAATEVPTGIWKSQVTAQSAESSYD